MGVNLVEFLDDRDVAMAVNTPSAELIEQEAYSALQIITDHGLHLASKKTKAVVITKKRAYHHPEISLTGTRISIK